MRPRLQRRLGQQPCPFPTLIDGKMERAEWIIGPHGLLKTDYEHHGMGKAELNLMDPAYDLAETILNLTLSPEEESRLIRRYIEESGDASVEQRLFMNKLLAGLWAMDSAQEHLFDKSQAAHRQQEIHERFLSAWNFLTVHAARLCGSHCRPPQELRWRPPLLALDIDGVLDRRLAGGVAEHGSYLCDAVAQRGRVLIIPEAMHQLEELRSNLRLLPGVFLDDRHQYSMRAYTYQDKTGGLLASTLKSVRSFSVGVGAPAPYQRSSCII
jgi:hypothetical protein